MADDWSAAQYDVNARFVSDLGQGVLDWLDPRAGERILDLGCGDGALTERLVAAEADVLGVDGSADMVAAAAKRGIDAQVMDGHALNLKPEFDAVFSNAALHWMTDPHAVLEGVIRALKPGGRFVGEFGGHGNVAAIRTALSAVIKARTGVANAPDSIWYFPTVAEYKARLEAVGFAVQRIALIPRPTAIPGDMTAWVGDLGGTGSGLCTRDMRRAVMMETEALLRPALCDDSGNWTADYIRLRF